MDSPETLFDGIPSGSFAFLAALFESFPSQRGKEILEPFLHCYTFCDLIFIEKKRDVDIAMVAAVAHFIARAEEPGERGKHGDFLDFLAVGM